MNNDFLHQTRKISRDNMKCVKCSCVVFFSAILSSLGNLLSQALESKKKLKEGQSRKEVDLYGPIRFALYGYDGQASISYQSCSELCWAIF